MKRRGFLAFMGGAAVAGPSMAKQAASGIGLEAMALGSNAPNYDMPIGDYGSEAGIGGGEYDHGKWLRERLAEVVGISDSERSRRLAAIQPSALDPDLAVNRSMSLQHKVREQKRRLLNRSLEAERFSLAKDLADYVKRQTGLAA